MNEIITSICKICQCPTEKQKIIKKAGNICNVCARNDAKVKRMMKQRATCGKLKKVYNKGILIRRSTIRELIDNNKDKIYVKKRN
jgi:hypothetical protein